MISDNDTLKLYMANIMQYPRVSTAEEARLAKRIAQGDLEARTTLINANLRLVVKISHDFKGRGLPLLDLISEGNIGLMRAVEKFDPTKGAKLSSYAAWWIKQSMRRALSNQAQMIRVPPQSAMKMVKIHAAETKLTQELGRTPTAKEIATAANLTERTVNGLRVGRSTTVSLQAPLQPGMDGELTDVLADESTVTPDRQLDDIEMMDVLQKLLASLDERERQILDLRFGLTRGVPCTLERVSEIIKLTRERVRQIQNQALLALRALINEESLAEATRGTGDRRRIAELLASMAARAAENEKKAKESRPSSEEPRTVAEVEDNTSAAEDSEAPESPELPSAMAESVPEEAPAEPPSPEAETPTATKESQKPLKATKMVKESPKAAAEAPSEEPPVPAPVAKTEPPPEKAPAAKKSSGHKKPAPPDAGKKQAPPPQPKTSPSVTPKPEDPPKKETTPKKVSATVSMVSEKPTAKASAAPKSAKPDKPEKSSAKVVKTEKSASSPKSSPPPKKPSNSIPPDKPKPPETVKKAPETKKVPTSSKPSASSKAVSSKKPATPGKKK